MSRLLIWPVAARPRGRVAFKPKRLREPSFRMVGVTVHPPPRLFGRTGELEILGRLIANVRSGQSAVLVVRGEPGIGKTELLRHLVAEASGFWVARVAGVESEMELPFAGLHQLCAPMLGRLPSLAEPQRRGLSVAFGLASGDSPDRFLVALAALSLIEETSEEQPMLCVVDDAQWLDQASAQVLGFIGRRLLAESIALVFAVRTPAAGDPAPNHLAGLPELRLGGLDEQSARALLATVTSGPLDEGVRGRILAEAHGHPLALSSSTEAGAPPTLPAGSLFRTRETCPGASKISTQRGLVSCQPRSSGWSCSRRPIRSGTRR